MTDTSEFMISSQMTVSNFMSGGFLSPERFACAGNTLCDGESLGTDEIAAKANSNSYGISVFPRDFVSCRSPTIEIPISKEPKMIIAST